MALWSLQCQALHKQRHLCHFTSTNSAQDKIDFWSNVYGFSMEPIRELARSEPLVDTVHSDLLTTTPCIIKDIDINTMTEADIPFAAPFEIVAHRDDHLHALVLWFDIYFGTSHKPVRPRLGLA